MGNGDLQKIQWLWENATLTDVFWLSDMRRFENYAQER